MKVRTRWFLGLLTLFIKENSGTRKKKRKKEEPDENENEMQFAPNNRLHAKNNCEICTFMKILGPSTAYFQIPTIIDFLVTSLRAQGQEELERLSFLTRAATIA